jgi:hypothetical protein
MACCSESDTRELAIRFSSNAPTSDETRRGSVDTTTRGNGPRHSRAGATRGDRSRARSPNEFLRTPQLAIDQGFVVAPLERGSDLTTLCDQAGDAGRAAREPGGRDPLLMSRRPSY